MGAKEKVTEGFDVMEWLSGPQDISEGDALPDLAGVASGGFAGYKIGAIRLVSLSGRSPVVLPAEERVPGQWQPEHSDTNSTLILSFQHLS